MTKETITCDENIYKIQTIELGSVNNNFYLNFYFANDEEAKKFENYLKITLSMLMNDAQEPIQFKQLNHSQSSNNPVSLVGNIKQAIDFLTIDNIFSLKTQKILVDKDEEKIQKLLNDSKKCTRFVSTVDGGGNHIDHYFFSKTAEKKGSIRDSLAKMLGMK